MSPYLSFVIPILTIIGSGLSAYIGVRVALAEIRKDIGFIQKSVDDHNERLRWLEREGGGGAEDRRGR